MMSEAIFSIRAPLSSELFRNRTRGREEEFRTSDASPATGVRPGRNQRARNEV